MKRVLTVLAAGFVLSTVTPAGAADRYGQPLTVEKIVKVSEIVDSPEQYVGKEVKVEGMIVEVCAKRGCWMEIASDRRYEKIRIKVDDGVIVFPLSARGRKALVQGRVEEVSMSAEEAQRFLAHQAEEKGTPFDPSSVTGPVTFYQIRATGAVID